jgi:hypothetical protein
MTITLNVPAEIYEVLAQAAGDDDVSLERVASAALGEQVAQWARIRDLAARPVSREQFLAVLDSAPDCEPAHDDRL